MLGSFFYSEFLKVSGYYVYNLTSRLYNISINCMHTIFLLVNRNDTQRKNVFKTFKANEMDLIEYDQTSVPIQVNNNHW